MSEHWLSFAYQYLIGGAFFFFVVFLAMKNRALDLRLREGKSSFFILIGGFVFFFVGHFLWIYLLTG